MKNGRIDPKDDPRLTAYALGELDSSEAAAVARELELEPSQARASAEIGALGVALRRALAAPTAAALTPAQRTAILSRAQRARFTPTPAPSLRSLRPWLVAAGVLILAGGGWLLLRAYQDSEPATVFTYSAFGSSDSRERDASAGIGYAARAEPEMPPSGEPAASRPSELPHSVAGEAARAQLAQRSEKDPNLDALPAVVFDPSAMSPADPGAIAAQGYSSSLALNPNVALQGSLFVSDEATTALQALGYSSSDVTVDREADRARRPEVAPGTESYVGLPERGFQRPLESPLATFSIDVDSASYANTRRFLREGRLPPPEAVRIEEFLNYFPYSYEPPRDGQPFAVHLELADCPWAEGHRLVRIGIRGRASSREAPRGRNLVFLLDVSGSMAPDDKLPLVKASMQLLLDELSEADRVAIVTYAGSSGVALEPTSCEQKHDIRRVIDSLSAGGSTNGAGGIQMAYELARKSLVPGGVNRVILATDGDFNVGVTDRSALVELIEREARSGVFLSVLGVGTGNLKDATMEQLADKGNGNYAYLDGLTEARKVLVEELHGTLETIAKDVKIQVELNPATVGAYRLIGYENRALAARDFNDDTKDAGEIGAAHAVTALVEIVPIGLPVAGSVDALKYQPTEAAASVVAPGLPHGNELLTVKLRWKEPDGVTSSKIELPLANSPVPFERASSDLRFAAAVAAFGQVLRGSSLRGSTSLAQVREIAAGALGADPGGYRQEFLRLVDQALQAGAR
jgi:Ca-activated chloride channel family protein